MNRVTFYSIIIAILIALGIGTINTKLIVAQSENISTLFEYIINGEPGNSTRDARIRGNQSGVQNLYQQLIYLQERIEKLEKLKDKQVVAEGTTLCYPRVGGGVICYEV